MLGTPSSLASLAPLARKVLLTLGVGLAVTGCALDSDLDDEEDADASEDALKNAPKGKLQIYNMNTHHLSEPGKPSFEVTDYRQMVHYMKEQQYLPDFILLSEVGRNNEVPSQPCRAFVNYLEKTLSKKGRIKYKCEVAKGSVNELDNAGGGTAIVYRESYKPIAKKVLVQWVLDKKTKDKCIPDPTGPGLTFIQTFRDGNKTAALASLHLVSPSAGPTNQYDQDCSAKNLREITAALDAIEADVKIFGGDMNHADARRHMEGDVVVHDNWESGYAHTNGALAKQFSPNAGYKDAWFNDCAKTCKVKTDGTESFSKEETQCVSSCLARVTSVGRIDWVFAKGASSLTKNVSIPFAEARAAYVRQTGDTNAVEKYSDHLAQRILVGY